MTPTITVAVAGLTHLGIVTAAGLAEKGFRIVAWDPDPDRARRLAAGDSIVSEPGLKDLLNRNRDRLIFSERCADLGDADLIYIAADVPTDDQGQSTLQSIVTLINEVSATRAAKALLTILCQVPPGFTRRLEVPKDRLFYQVETLIFGRAVERALQPERFIIGCADPGQPLPPALNAVLSAHGCPILPMRYESAELAKVSINCFLVAQVTTTNTLAEICETIGADWSEISPALKLDRRIGPHAYLAPGLGISGGNLERDLATVTELSRGSGDGGAHFRETEAGVVDAWRHNSAWRKDWLYRALERTVLRNQDDPRVAVLGLAYKENTDSIKNSPSIALLEQLKGQRIRVHDPVVPTSLVPWAEPASSPLDACIGADVLVIATPWPVYREMSLTDIAAQMKGRFIIDPFAVLRDQQPEERGFSWQRLGAPSD
jgi:UDPglucose 6-dehydrogenase